MSTVLDNLMHAGPSFTCKQFAMAVFAAVLVFHRHISDQHWLLGTPQLHQPMGEQTHSEADTGTLEIPVSSEHAVVVAHRTATGVVKLTGLPVLVP